MRFLLQVLTQRLLIAAPIPGTRRPETKVLLCYASQRSDHSTKGQKQLHEFAVAYIEFVEYGQNVIINQHAMNNLSALNSHGHSPLTFSSITRSTKPQWPKKEADTFCENEKRFPPGWPRLWRAAKCLPLLNSFLVSILHRRCDIAVVRRSPSKEGGVT